MQVGAADADSDYAATGDFRYVYGLNAINKVRFIQGAGGTQMVVEYYFFRTINI